MSLASTLRAVPLFSQLRDTDLELLSGMLTPRDYPKNRVIRFSHDPFDAFYVVVAGQIKVMLIAEDGREVVLSVLRQNDHFGETALMDDEPYSAGAIAMEDSKVLVLRRDDFRRCITDIPGMAFGLLRALCVRLLEADHKIGGLMLLDVTGRVSHLLLDLAARHGNERIPDAPTHQLIAQMVGSSRESVSRTFSALTAQGAIEVTGSELRIVNREVLETAAGQMLKRRLKTAPAVRQLRESDRTPRTSGA